MSLRFLAIAVVVVSLVGCGKEQEPAKSASAPGVPTPGPVPQTVKDKTKESAPQIPAKADFTVSAVELCEEYKKDRQATDAKYKDKWIEVSGDLTNFGVLPGDRHFVALEGRADPATSKEFGMKVMCQKVEKEPWKRYGRPQKLKVIGKWMGIVLTSETHLTDCKVIEAGPSGAAIVTAEQLAKEGTADDAVETKYKDKNIIIRGEIVARTDEGGPPSFELKGDGKTKVSCGAWDKEPFAGWKAGQKVELIGQLAPFQSKGEVALFACFPRSASK